MRDQKPRRLISLFLRIICSPDQVTSDRPTRSGWSTCSVREGFSRFSSPKETNTLRPKKGPNAPSLPLYGQSPGFCRGKYHKPFILLWLPGTKFCKFYCQNVPSTRRLSMTKLWSSTGRRPTGDDIWPVGLRSDEKSRRDSTIVTPYERWEYYQPARTSHSHHLNYAENKTKQGLALTCILLREIFPAFQLPGLSPTVMPEMEGYSTLNNFQNTSGIFRSSPLNLINSNLNLIKT